MVVINPQGELENANAFRVIRLAGMGAFPFTITKEKSPLPAVHKLHVIFADRNSMTGSSKVKVSLTLNEQYTVHAVY